MLATRQHHQAGATQVVPGDHTVPGPSRGGSVAVSQGASTASPCNAQIRDELLSPGPGPSTIITKLLIRAWCQELWGQLGLSTVEQSCWWQQCWLCPCFWFSIHCLYPWPGITSSRWSRFSAPSSSRGWDTNKWTQCATAQLQTCHQLIDSYQFVQLKNVFTLIGRAGKIKFLDIHLDKTRYKWQLIDVPKSDKTRLVLRRRGDGDTEPRCCILPALQPSNMGIRKKMIHFWSHSADYELQSLDFV